MRPSRFSPTYLMPLILCSLVGLIMLVALARFVLYAFIPNVYIANNTGLCSVYIRTGSTFQNVVDTLISKGILFDVQSFKWLSKRKNYPHHVHAGHYRLTSGMSNNELINMLRAGWQVPVKIMIQNARTKEDIAGQISKKIETDSISLLMKLNDHQFLAMFGVTPEKSLCLFLPNTYKFYWNTTAEGVIHRMFREYKKFWNEERIMKAKAIGLDIQDVFILASIVEKETEKGDEKSMIASVYLNRMKKGISLQADPTILYAWNDPSIKRVLKRHTVINSPFNTYLNKVLPPGPICLPSLQTIDAVLQAPENQYLYFCAKEDLGGYHVFAKTLREHNKNARRYQMMLNKMNIR